MGEAAWAEPELQYRAGRACDRGSGSQGRRAGASRRGGRVPARGDKVRVGRGRAGRPESRRPNSTAEHRRISLAAKERGGFRDRARFSSGWRTRSGGVSGPDSLEFASRTGPRAVRRAAQDRGLTAHLVSGRCLDYYSAQLAVPSEMRLWRECQAREDFSLRTPTQRLLMLGVVFVMVGCSAQAGGTSSPVATATASPTGRPTPRITPTPRPTPVPTPEPKGELTKTQAIVLAWKAQYSDYVSYQVIVEVKNTGSGWAQQSAFNSDFTILGPDGGVVTTGSFLYAYPEFVGPGETGYLMTDGSDIGGNGSRSRITLR